METSLLIKIGYALREMFSFFRKTSAPRLVMTLLVKNEEEMLEQNLLFHKKMGVDAFIVTDNNSTDGTMEIIEKYRKKGWIVEVIRETATDYEQKAWVDRMIWHAKTRFGADWVINADADEFWFSPLGNLKKELSATSANVLVCEVRCMYPEEGRPFWAWTRAVKPVPNPMQYGLSLYSLFGRQNYKVAHRADGYLQISMGNHKVKMFPYRELLSSIRVYHYNIRNCRQFVEKMVNGGKQLELHKGRHGGRHWRYFYKLYKEGQLEEEYNRVIGADVYQDLADKGYIYLDTSILNVFGQMGFV